MRDVVKCESCMNRHLGFVFGCWWVAAHGRLLLLLPIGGNCYTAPDSADGRLSRMRVGGRCTSNTCMTSFCAAGTPTRTRC